MRPSEAATIIGISRAQCRQAIRKGLLPAKKRKNPLDPHGHIYDVSERDAVYYRDHRPKRGPKKRKPANEQSNKTVL